MSASLKAQAPKNEVPGAKLTMTIAALIEGLYFGLFLLLATPDVYAFFLSAAPTPVEMVFARIIGGVSLALGLGCWYARTSVPVVVQLVNIVMMVAKGLSAALLMIYLIVGTLPPLFWLNFAVAVFLAGLNALQFAATKVE